MTILIDCLPPLNPVQLSGKSCTFWALCTTTLNSGNLQKTPFCWRRWWDNLLKRWYPSLQNLTVKALGVHGRLLVPPPCKSPSSCKHTSSVSLLLAPSQVKEPVKTTWFCQFSLLLGMGEHQNERPGSSIWLSFWEQVAWGLAPPWLAAGGKIPSSPPREFPPLVFWEGVFGLRLPLSKGRSRFLIASVS